MNILGLVHKFARSLESGDSITKWLSSGNQTATGKRIDEEAAYKIATAYACVRIISTQMALLPCFVYKRMPKGGKERQYKHRLHRALHVRPNPLQSPVQFKMMMTAHACLRGNAYAVRSTDDFGRPTLWPLHPDLVTPQWRNDAQSDIEYKVRDKRGKEEILYRDEIFHLRWLSSDMLKARAPIEDLKEPLGVAMAAEEFIARFFSNGARPSGLLKLKTPIKKEAKEQLKKDWHDSYGGVSNAWKVPLLEGDLDWQNMSLSNDQNQIAEILKLSVPQICRIWGVPPHMVADLERATFSNIGEQRVEFYTECLMPWKVCWEQDLMLSLLEENELEDYLIEHEEKAILLGDVKARSEALQIQRQNGVINADEWRELENMNPIGGGQGKFYLVNAAMTSAKAAEAGQVKPERSELPEQTRAALGDLFADAFGRLRRKEAKAATAARKENRGLAFVEEFYPKHRELIRETLSKPVAAAARLVTGIDPAKLETFIEAFVAGSIRTLTGPEADAEIRGWETGAPPADATSLLAFLTDGHYEKA